MVSNGRSLTMIDYEVNQVQRWPIKNSPLGALLDPKRDIAKYGKLQPTSNSDVVSIEVRDPGRPEFGVITLIFVRKASAPGGAGADQLGWRSIRRITGPRFVCGIIATACRLPTARSPIATRAAQLAAPGKRVDDRLFRECDDLQSIVHWRERLIDIVFESSGADGDGFSPVASVSKTDCPLKRDER